MLWNSVPLRHLLSQDNGLGQSQGFFTFSNYTVKPSTLRNGDNNISVGLCSIWIDAGTVQCNRNLLWLQTKTVDNDPRVPHGEWENALVPDFHISTRFLRVRHCVTRAVFRSVHVWNSTCDHWVWLHSDDDVVCMDICSNFLQNKSHQCKRSEFNLITCF